MKNLLKKSLKNITYASVLLFCNLATAEQVTVNVANNYPYKNLINRTDVVKIFYITDNNSLICRVEVILGNMKWASVEKKISKELFNNDPLSYCLSRESAEKILLQSSLQFGRGL